MRCTVEKCKKRFKGKAGAPCPVCGSRAKPDAWAAKKEWNRRLCDCDGSVYTPEKDYARHRRGSRGCVHEFGDLDVAESPGTGEEYPF
jgi:hypothetical protein